jgi:hypothetical protein
VRRTENGIPRARTGQRTATAARTVRPAATVLLRARRRARRKVPRRVRPRAHRRVRPTALLRARPPARRRPRRTVPLRARPPALLRVRPRAPRRARQPARRKARRKALLRARPKEGRHRSAVEPEHPQSCSTRQPARPPYERRGRPGAAPRTGAGRDVPLEGGYLPGDSPGRPSSATGTPVGAGQPSDSRVTIVDDAHPARSTPARVACRARPGPARR